MRSNRSIFATPGENELLVVRQIYRVTHFQYNIEERKLQAGGLNADPFVVARAKVSDATVVTLEKESPNAAKIPNFCRHLNVDCIDLERFMEKENWRF